VTTDRWYDKQCNKKEQLIALCGLAQQVKFWIQLLLQITQARSEGMLHVARSEHRYIDIMNWTHTVTVLCCVPQTARLYLMTVHVLNFFCFVLLRPFPLFINKTTTEWLCYVMSLQVKVMPDVEVMWCHYRLRLCPMLRLCDVITG
jgi:hypothetical protein